ncbi:MAG: galactokinase [Acidobacteriota bacterium]|nr:galactokinase [Acidobacteriota bacterium]
MVDSLDIVALQEAFSGLYGKSARLFSAPGRVNLIGEHTDYNEGFVLPMAIDRRTFVAGAATDDNRVRVRSLDLDEERTFFLDDKKRRDSRSWVDYVEGVCRVLEESGNAIDGADLAISSEVPIGAGLSSSAALEISAGIALLSLAGCEVDLAQLALAGQKAEQVYAGTNCGIMDQLTAAFGQKNHALLIDCRSLLIKPIRLNLPDHAIVVCNTNVKHELATSAYNDRRLECERAVALLREMIPEIRALRDVTPSDLEQYEDLLPQPILRRCRHVLSENERTLRAAEALSEGNVQRFGGLMLRSHRSLRDDYQVSCDELDLMVEIAMSHDGVAGARMTGGGFGGCTVNLVRRDAVQSFSEFVDYSYERKTGITSTTYMVEAGEGVSEITNVAGSRIER